MGGRSLIEIPIWLFLIWIFMSICGFAQVIKLCVEIYIGGDPRAPKELEEIAPGVWAKREIDFRETRFGED